MPATIKYPSYNDIIIIIIYNIMLCFRYFHILTKKKSETLIKKKYNI